MKKAGIYDRWLHTLGGGESHTVAIANFLAKQDYDVELLTHRPVDENKLKTKFGINELNFKIKYLPELWDYELSEYTKKYDLFVLSSFADVIKSQAKKSLHSVFFPVSLNLSLKEFFTRVIVVPIVRFLFNFTLYIDKFESQVFLATNKKSKQVKIQIKFEALALSVVEQLKVSSLHSNVKFSHKVLHQKNIVEISAISDKPIRQWITNLPDSEYSKDFTVVLKQNFFNRLGEKLISLIPSWHQRFVAGPRKFSIDDLNSYTATIANSNFTSKWIKKYWNLNSQTVYPPVNIEEFKPRKSKNKWIVSTGRFFVGGHNKKQLEMVEAFRKIHRQLPGWELHLVGSVNPGRNHEDYFNKVSEAAKNLPVIIHRDIGFSQLQNILSKSSIYWHASGLGIDENKYPVMLEHFGITIVEAMAAGCVPVVINKGGAKKIVENVNFTWDSIEELNKETILLATDQKLMDELKNKAIDASKKYSLNNFEASLKKIINEIENEE